MGFSTTIASSIVLIALLSTLFSAASTTLQCVKDLAQVTKEYVARERERLDVKLELEAEVLNATACNITVKNTGAKTVFLQEQNGFQWNTVILSYENGSNWKTYTVEQYVILEIRVTGKDHVFNVTEHSFISPGEEARIEFQLPEDAPGIPVLSVVAVTFISHYGVTATTETVRQQ